MRVPDVEWSWALNLVSEVDGNIVEAPNPDQGPMGNLQGIGVSIMLGAKFRSTHSQ